MLPRTTYSAYLVDSTGKNGPQAVTHDAVDSIDYGKIQAGGIEVFNRCRDNCPGKWDKLVIYKLEPVVIRETFL